MGRRLAGTGVLAATVIALSCASLAGCAPQSDSAFHTVADPTPNAAAVQQQPPRTSDRDVATSTSSAHAAQSQSPQSADVTVASSNAAAVQPKPGAASAVASTSDYRILSGDVLQITVFQVQDFNRDAQVDAAGNIALPLIGGVPAAGKTVHEVESEIAGRLRAKYLQDPQVLVTIKDAVGLRVSVQGAVKSPGVIQIRGDTTVTTVCRTTKRVQAPTAIPSSRRCALPRAITSLKLRNRKISTSAANPHAVVSTAVAICCPTENEATY